MLDEEPEQDQLMLKHELIEDIDNKKQICEEYLKLQRDIHDLDEIMKTCAAVVTEQEEPINNIEANIENTLIHVKEGKKELSKASKLARTFGPITGAVVAGCVGGPVGAFMGLNVGIASAIGSALLGYGGAKLIQKVKEDNS